MSTKKEKDIFMTTQSVSLETSIKVLKETVVWFKKQIEPHDCGWMYTTIEGLRHRIKILRSERKKIISCKIVCEITDFSPMMFGIRRLMI